MPLRVRSIEFIDNGRSHLGRLAREHLHDPAGQVLISVGDVIGDHADRPRVTFDRSRPPLLNGAPEREASVRPGAGQMFLVAACE